MPAGHLWLSGAGPVGPRRIHGDHTMFVAARKTLTWGTIAAAVVSALLLACAGGMPRLTDTAGDTLRAWQVLPARPGLVGPRDAVASGADRSARDPGAAARSH
jgi:hypothetical protein